VERDSKRAIIQACTYTRVTVTTILIVTIQNVIDG